MNAAEPKRSTTRLVIGWITVTGSILLSSFWAFWGINENFHEGWYHHHLGKNLAMLFGQYLFAMILFMVAALLSVRWNWVGVLIHSGGAVFILCFFWGIHPRVMVELCGALLLFAAGYTFGIPRPKKLAYILLIGIPLLVTIGFGIEPAIRVFQRVDDMDRNARRVTINGVDLI